MGMLDGGTSITVAWSGGDCRLRMWQVLWLRVWANGVSPTQRWPNNISGWPIHSVGFGCDWAGGGGGRYYVESGPLWWQVHKCCQFLYEFMCRAYHQKQACHCVLTEWDRARGREVGREQCSRLKPPYEYHFEGFSNFSSSVEGLVEIQDVNPRI